MLLLFRDPASATLYFTKGCFLRAIEFAIAIAVSVVSSAQSALGTTNVRTSERRLSTDRLTSSPSSFSSHASLALNRLHYCCCSALLCLLCTTALHTDCTAPLATQRNATQRTASYLSPQSHPVPVSPSHRSFLHTTHCFDRLFLTRPHPPCRSLRTASPTTCQN